MPGAEFSAVVVALAPLVAHGLSGFEDDEHFVCPKKVSRGNANNATLHCLALSRAFEQKRDAILKDLLALETLAAGAAKARATAQALHQRADLVAADRDEDREELAALKRRKLQRHAERARRDHPDEEDGAEVLEEVNLA